MKSHGKKAFIRLTCGTISGNIADRGGGVCNSGAVFSMLGGEILGNKAISDGGGVYNTERVDNGMYYWETGKHFDSSFNLIGGTISGNIADNGGGVWVDINKLGNLYVSDGVMFSNNLASISYDRNPEHDDVYAKHVSNKVVWTEPFTQGYNNYDISYITDSKITTNNDESIDTNNKIPNISDKPSNNIIIFITVFAVLTLCVIITVLFFYLKKPSYKLGIVDK